MPVTTGTKKKVVVKSAGHPAAFRKMACPRCKQGYAIGDNRDGKTYKCTHCGARFTTVAL